ncbi:hypothetical protein ACFSJW_08195 [Flavobacterium artemisiae]|uniref:YcxB-like protein n=1 Tax=Flavobacterium artemisiae TaxID=2126556 RepID=A0ABW4HHQ5_9FLAO
MKSELNSYYNFTATGNKISYDPYWYAQSYIFASSVLGIMILTVGIILIIYNNHLMGLFFSVLTSVLLVANSLYRLLIRNKTTLIFDKKNNSFYKITPLGKKDITALNSVQNVISKSRSHSFGYFLTVKTRKSEKIIAISSSIKSSNQDNPEVRFFQMEIIPQIESFLQIDKNTMMLFDSEECVSI